MNREIKFRAWDKKEKKMVNFIGTQTSQNALSPTRDNYILMQFTGLKDKNGKEIYEGDICHYLRKDYKSFDNDYERTFLIEWRDGGFWGKDSGIKIKDIADENCEVIGNIYENPELLA